MEQKKEKKEAKIRFFFGMCQINSPSEFQYHYHWVGLYCFISRSGLEWISIPKKKKIRVLSFEKKVDKTGKARP